MDVIRHFYSAYGLTIDSEVVLSPLAQISPAPADLFVRYAPITPGPASEPTKIYRAGMQARFAQDGPDRLWLFWPPSLSFMALDGRELLVDANADDPDWIALFTLSEAIGLILFQRGNFLLHGSAVNLSGQGVVFIGEPGAGKSTTAAAFAQQGHALISDDLVCIHIDAAGKPWLIPAFPQLKIWETTVNGLQVAKTHLTPVREGVNKYAWQESLAFASSAVPLSHIFVLQPPDSGRSEPQLLAPSQVPVGLLGHFPLADAMLQGEALRRYFEQSVQLARTVRVATLSRPENFDRLLAFVRGLPATL
ncbi:HPr kinase/phosphorylase [Spirosoma montaniterrae]|uniref:Serine kinase n=1 Tax=Spirosoma montaniterrae TaxID=1178516 RepID=A0A1P9WS97_9BACT|nr:serine kinase [Spirosoma montaniterrae]AQG78239.1 serine kinase [Spirosoma montaniterrae]